MTDQLEAYRKAILANASSEPKTVFSLMDGVGAWETGSACRQIEYLVAEGFLREHHRTGSFFQDRYFVTA